MKRPWVPLGRPLSRSAYCPRASPRVSVIEEWLIDGYNVYHAWRRKQRGASLTDLLMRLSDLAAGPAPSGAERRFVVVLDGRGEDADLAAYRTERCQVLRSGKMDADSFIERLIYELKATRRLTLVTDDRPMRQLAHGAGCRLMGTEEFLTQSALFAKQRIQELDRRRFLDERQLNRPFERLL